MSVPVAVTAKLPTGLSRTFDATSRADAYAFADWTGWIFDESTWWYRGGTVDSVTGAEITQGEYWYSIPASRQEIQARAGDYAVMRTGATIADGPMSPQEFADSWQ